MGESLSSLRGPARQARRRIQKDRNFQVASYRLTRNMSEIQFDRLLGQRLVIVDSIVISTLVLATLNKMNSV